MGKDIAELIGNDISKNERLNESRKITCINYFNEIIHDDLKEIFIKMLETNIAPDFIFDKLDNNLDKSIINRFKNRHSFKNDFICMNILLNELIIESHNRISKEVTKALESEDFNNLKNIIKIKEEA